MRKSPVMTSLIRSYYDTFNSGDREALLALLDDEIIHEINESDTETGKDAFRAFLARMDCCYKETVEDLTVFAGEDPPRAAADRDMGIPACSSLSTTRAAAEFFIRGEYLATDDGLPEANGQTYHLRVGAFFEVKDGRITRVTNHYNLQAWLEMVGH